jgi:hypothetical protein
MDNAKHNNYSWWDFRSQGGEYENDSRSAAKRLHGAICRKADIFNIYVIAVF